METGGKRVAQGEQGRLYRQSTALGAAGRSGNRAGRQREQVATLVDAQAGAARGRDRAGSVLRRGGVRAAGDARARLLGCGQAGLGRTAPVGFDHVGSARSEPSWVRSESGEQ